MKNQALLAAAAALALAGCASTPAPFGPLVGDWGGEHVGLHLERGGGALDYDCASGTIGPVVPDAAGRFTAPGTHSPGHGGPVWQGEVTPRFAARYAGIVSGDRMTLNVTIDPDTPMGPLVLIKGAAPNLLRCL
ncbi:MAG: hypothetical protein H0W71_06030 [Sphingomonas sp.]|nr:hypothetical protein [Sphingomonas sp.]